MLNPFLWYRDKQSLGIGDVCRYVIQYRRIDPEKHEIYFRLKNIEKTSLRAIHLLNGPFILYCHVVPYRYNLETKFEPEVPKANREVVFDNQIKPGQTFNVRLVLNDNSLVESTSEGDLFQWEVDVISQIVINRQATILYDLMVGDDMKELKKVNHGSLQNSLTVLGNKVASTLEAPNELEFNEWGQSRNPQLKVIKKTTKDIWDNHAPNIDEPIHLVWVTHGLFSNLTADMLYLKDSLESNVPKEENILVRGYRGNAGRTEKGVKKLGVGAGDDLVKVIEDLSAQGLRIAKVSFIGHSLGGLVQLYAMKHVLLTHGTDYFKVRGIQPYNLVCMAAPLLGILSEMSFVISWFLDLGTLGKTGRDLTLSKRMPSIKDLKKEHHHNHHKENPENESIKKSSLMKPVLEVLPDEPLRSFLEQFKHLTLYANAINDGIVPLRTSSLLYLDWRALGDAGEIRKKRGGKIAAQDRSDNHSIGSNTSRDGVGEAPDEDENEDDEDDELDSDNDNSSTKKKGFVEKYRDFLSLNNTINTPTKKKLSKKERALLKITAKGTDLNEDSKDETSDEDDESPEPDSDTYSTFAVPPKASAIESAINTILCPIPSAEYIMDPAHRDSVIFHDKYYHFKDLPQGHEEEGTSHQLKTFFFNYNEWKLGKQARIAKKYHTSKLNWRKVLVNLPPDAHNNIVVRRRFTNGFGWGVIEHLCTNLFTSEEPDDNGSESSIKAKM